MPTRAISPSPKRWPRLIVAACMTAYLGLSFDGLSVFPPVGEDEPWIAAAPYKLATEGVYGSDLFAGYYGVERHNYQHMPLYPLMQAGVFKLLGAGVLQMRVLPVLFGLALLAAVFIVGRQVGGARVGALAVVVMVALRIADTTPGSGILLLDRARVNRYDIAVPVFGLLALAAFGRGLREEQTRWWAATGVLTALASLSHLFGVFWLPVFVAALVLRPGDGRRIGPVVVLLGAFVATWIPWAAYVATGWADYLGQMRFVSSRLDVFTPSFYAANLLHGDGPISVGWLTERIRSLPLMRLGAWTVLLGAPVAVGLMAWKGIRDCSAVVVLLAFASLAQFVMFLALLQIKTINYMIGLWPLGALLLAWLGVWLWDRPNQWLRGALVMLIGLVVLEGAVGVGRARAEAREAIPYDAYTSDIARCIPAGSRVLGLQHYWLGLRQFPYRTWLLPIDLASARYYDRPMSLDAALERVNPDIILIDRFMARFFEVAAEPQHPSHRLHEEYAAFVARRRVEPRCVIQNRTYGPMLVYAVPKSAGS